MSFSWATCGSWLLHSAAAGGVLLLLTQGLARFVRQPARRQRLCEYGVMAAVLAAVLNLLLPGWLLVPHAGGSLSRGVSMPVGLTLDPPAAPARIPAAALRPEASDPDRAFEVKKAVAQAEPIETEALDERAPSLGEVALDWTRVWLLPALAVGHALGAGLFLIYLLAGHAALMRLLAKARPAPPDVVELFLPMIGNRRPPRLLVSGKVRVPLSCGLLRPTVVLPAALCEPANARKLRWIFAHELTHLQRRDAWSCLLFCVAQALYFYVPWFWWLRRQARLCQEFVADAVAALEEVPPVSYAEFLVSLTRAPAVPMAATGVAGQSSDLFRRVSMLLQNPVSVERDCPRRWSLLAAGSLLALAVVLSGISLTAAPARAQQEDVIVRQSQKEAAKDIVIQGSPVKITIHIEGGDKKEPVIRKNEEVKVFVVPSGDKAAKEKRYIYVTPRVIIEEKGDGKAAKEGTVRFRFKHDWAPAKEAPEAPARKGKVIWEKMAPESPKKEEKYHTLHGTIRLHDDLFFRGDEKGKSPVHFWAEKAGPAAVWFYQKADPNLDKLRKALEKLEKMPNVDAEQIRREVMKALEQLHKVRPDGDAKWHFDFRHAQPEKAPDGKIQIERKIERRQSEKKADGEKKAWFSIVEPQENTPYRAAEALATLALKAGQPRRLGVQVDLPGEILADQLNLPKGQGLVIKQVFPQTPAAKAGLKVGDILLRLGNEPVLADQASFPKTVKELPTGQDIEVIVIRKGKRRTIGGLRIEVAPERSGGDAKAHDPRQISEMVNKVIREHVGAHATDPQGLRTLAEVVSKSKAKTSAADKDGVLTTTLRKGDRFTTRHQEGSLIITVVGEVNNRDAVDITVQDGSTTHHYNRLSRVPASYRDKVSHLIDISTKGSAQLQR